MFELNWVSTFSVLVIYGFMNVSTSLGRPKEICIKSVFNSDQESTMKSALSFLMLSHNGPELIFSALYGI